MSDRNEETQQKQLGVQIFDISESFDTQPVHRGWIPDTGWDLDFQAYTFQDGVLAVPSTDRNPPTNRRTLSVLGIDAKSGILPFGRVHHTGIVPASECPGSPAIRRSIVIGDVLFTLSNYGTSGSRFS